MIRLLLVAAGIGLVTDAPAPKAWDKADLGKVPTGWKSLSTGEKGATKWELKADKKAGLALTQTGVSPGPVFNLCVADEPSVIARKEDDEGFVELPIRRVVERTNAWLTKDRRLCRSYEHTVSSEVAYIRIAMIHLMVRRSKPSPSQSGFGFERPAKKTA